MTALRPLSALMMLFAGVAAGLVDGVTAPTTPTALAISTRPDSGSSEITPTDRAPARSRNTPIVLRRFLAILSATLPSPVSRTEASASARLCSGSTIAQPTAVTTSSTSSWVAASNAACAARARAISAPTIAAASLVTGSRSLPPTSIDLDLRFADHVFPLRQFRVDPGREFRRRGRRRLRALREELFLDLGHREHFDECGLELGDDRRRRVRRCERAVPGVHDAVGNCFGDRRNVGRSSAALVARDRQRLETASLDVLYRRRERHDRELHLSAKRVGNGGTSAFVRHVHHVHAGLELEQLSGDICR